MKPKLIATLPEMTYSAHHVRFSPDSKFLASGGHGSGHRLWQAPDFKSHHALGSDDTIATKFAYTRDSQLLAIASTGDAVTIWETKSGKLLHSLPAKSPCRDVAFSADGKQLAGASGKSVYLWEVSSGKLDSKIDHKGIVERVSFHPDGRLIAKVGKLIAVGKDLVIENKNAPMRVILSPDGRTFVAGGGKFHLQCFDASNGKPTRIIGEDLKDQLYCAQFSADGRTILTSDRNGTVRLWDFATGELRTSWTGPSDGCTTGAIISPDGNLVAAQFDELRLYDIAGGEPLVTLPFIADENCLAISSNGEFLAAGSDEALNVWSLN